MFLFFYLFQSKSTVDPIDVFLFNILSQFLFKEILLKVLSSLFFLEEYEFYTLPSSLCVAIIDYTNPNIILFSNPNIPYRISFKA